VPRADMPALPLPCRTLRPVQQDQEQGEELMTISYIELAATGQERRQELLQQYVFDCQQPLLQPQLGSYSIWPEPAAVQALPGGRVAWHGPDPSPPWPAEACDGQLTALEVRTAAGWQLLPGGMHYRLLQGFPGAGPSEGGSSDEEEEGAMPEAGQATAGSSIAGLSSSQLLRLLLGASGSSGSAGSSPREVEVYCWGPALTLPSAAQAAPGAVQVDAASAAAGLLQVQQLLQQAEAASRQQQHRQAISLLQKALHVGSHLTTSTSSSGVARPAAAGAAAQVCLGPRHVLRMRTKALLLKACIDEGSSWQLALQVARELLPQYQLVYTQPWPNLALHLAALAKLESLAGDVAQALQAASSAAAGHPWRRQQCVC
jgi:hypothetical protein